MEKFSLDFKKTTSTGCGWFWWAATLWIIGIILAVIGIITETTIIKLGLEAMSWYLLSIASFLAGISVKISWVGAVLIKSKEEK